MDIFFSLLQLKTKRCTALSPAFLQDVLNISRNKPTISATKACQLLSRKQKASLLSAEFIFLPFFDKSRKCWNLIALSKTKKGAKDQETISCLHIFNGGRLGGTMTTEERLSLR